MDIRNRFFYSPDPAPGGPPPAPPATPPATPPAPAAPETPPKTYTEAEVNGLVTRKEAEATAKLLKELGVESTGKLKDDLKLLKEIQDKDKTEAQKASEAAKTATDKQTAAEARASAAEVKAEALVLGVDPKKIDRAVKLIPAYDGDTPAAKVAAFLAEMPEFKAGAGGQDFGGPSKNQGGDTKAATQAALEAAMGIKKTA